MTLKQHWLDAFIKRAGFTYGWTNLESWARRIAERAYEERAGWRPMEEAPKDRPILGWCVHEANPYVAVPPKLNIYASHAEGFGHAEDGPNVLVWGGAWDDRSYEDPDAGWAPDWWFVKGSDFEEPANPIAWAEIPVLEPPILTDVVGQSFEVWMEGYRATGDAGKADLLGVHRAASFREACVITMRFRPELARYFDKERLTVWGCRLFDNEADARRRFG